MHSSSAHQENLLAELSPILPSWTSFEWRYAGAQTIALCKEAVSGWAQYSMQGRQTALGAAKQAMDSADTCHKELVAVFKTHS